MQPKKMKQTCWDVLDRVEVLQKKATAKGLTMRVVEVDCRKGWWTLHVMFDSAQRRILNWWPGNGKVYSPVSGEKRVVSGFDEALSMAEHLAVPTVSEEMDRHLDSIARS